MSDAEEYRCFIGNLSWTTTDDSLEDAFSKYGKISDAKVVMDKFSGRSRGFGFVTFNEKEDMEEAIEKMNGGDLDGRSITVDRAQPGGGGGGGGRDRDRDRGGDRGGYDRGDRRGGDRGGDRRGGGGGGGGGGDCFKCGKPGHFARECPSAGGDRYGGRDDRYGGGGGGGGGGRYSGGPDRNGGSRGGDRYSGGSRNGGGGGGGGSRDRSGPYDRR